MCSEFKEIRDPWNFALNESTFETCYASLIDMIKGFGKLEELQKLCDQAMEIECED